MKSNIYTGRSEPKYWLIAIQLIAGLSLHVACSTGRKGHMGKDLQQHTGIRADFDTVASFDDLLKRRYADQYRKMFDELDLNNADTVVFFARPCYTHFGLVLKVNNHRYKAYYFSFSKEKEQVKLIARSPGDIREYLSFFYEKDTVNISSCPEEEVRVSHPCPVLISARMGSQFYQKEINLESCFFERSASFGKLLSNLKKDIEESNGNRDKE